MRDRPSLKPIIPHKLLGPMSMASGSCNSYSGGLAVSQRRDSPDSDSERRQNDQVDVEMGRMDDFDTGSCFLEQDSRSSS